MANLIKRFIAEEEGLELLEYAILGAILVVGLVTVYQTLGGEISAALDGINGALQDAPNID